MSESDVEDKSPITEVHVRLRRASNITMPSINKGRLDMGRGGGGREGGAWRGRSKNSK